jgi:hypothetical protein
VQEGLNVIRRHGTGGRRPRPRLSVCGRTHPASSLADLRGGRFWCIFPCSRTIPDPF